MKYTQEEVIMYAQEEDVKFIRLAFCDVFGKHKNISIMTGELDRAFDKGIAIDASAIRGFGDEAKSDLFLHPDPSTLAILPWRPEHGRVVRMFCYITRPDGTPFECDGRTLLKNAEEYAKNQGSTINHFYEKLLLLREMMNTPSARKLAEDRHRFMEAFLDEFFAEWEGKR